MRHQQAYAVPAYSLRGAGGSDPSALTGLLYAAGGPGTRHSQPAHLASDGPGSYWREVGKIKVFSCGRPKSGLPSPCC